jgi:glucose-6-phosphate isomerase
MLNYCSPQKRAERVFESQRWWVPHDLYPHLSEAMNDWRDRNKTLRLWSRDASLWTGTDEANWLGWLTVTDTELLDTEKFIRLGYEIKEEGFEHIVILGMGGSCLCVEVLATIFGNVVGFPQVLVLDTTDPAQIHRVASQIHFRKTLFIVSSKSGTTLETNILERFFFEQTKKVVGPARAGTHFIAITDSGSELHRQAEVENFRHVFFGVKSVGGRFSVLSNFGIVPVALMGIDIEDLLTKTEEMITACSSTVPLIRNPGAMLGLILGVAGNHGRDKITLVTSPGRRDFGAWVEQLLAESTGKNGRGLIPIDGEELGHPSDYGNDRLFCSIRDEDSANEEQDARIDALENAGHPVVRIDFDDKYDVGQEFFRWEFAVAVAGSVLGLNPFDQPDVEASKIVTHELMAEYEARGSLPTETPVVEGHGLQLFADERNVAEIMKHIPGERPVAAFLAAHLERLQPGDYFALLAWVDMNDEHRAILETIRHEVRHHFKVATSLGFGPRYLHSTGQAFKGGPNRGVFLQVTYDDAVDLPVPGHKYSFGVVKAAQARGDFNVLAARGRRLLRVHLGADVEGGLVHLRELIEEAVK